MIFKGSDPLFDWFYNSLIAGFRKLNPAFYEASVVNTPRSVSYIGL